MKDINSLTTLSAALSSGPHAHRQEHVAQQDMNNTSTHPTTGALSFWADWELSNRPRRIALLVDDAQEEYRPYAQDILGPMQDLVHVFRETPTNDSDTTLSHCPIAWSTWTRRYDDGISNAMDRFYGPCGLNPKNYQNALYLAQGAHGARPLEEIAPTQEEIHDGWWYAGVHLDMFWKFREDGKSYLDEKLKEHHIDTVVLMGLWTDECIVATAYGAFSRGYDVVVVRDAVATATANQKLALTILNGVCSKVLSSKEIVKYMKHDFVWGPPGAVKGNQHPDGRKDSSA